MSIPAHIPNLIIGAGPAGMATAIQLLRYGEKVLLLEKNRPGGLLWNANLVENYPGFPRGIPGPKLVTLFERQLQQVGGEIIFDEVISLEYFDTWQVFTQNKGMFFPQTVIIASGTVARPFPVPVPPEANERVLSEVWPLLERKISGKRVAIVGAGDAAFDYALNLAGHGNFVTILNRGKTIKSLPLLWERAANIDKIRYRPEIVLRAVQYDAESGQLCLSLDSHAPLPLPEKLYSDYLLFAIGREPALNFMKDSVKRQMENLMANGKLYFVGDVHNGLFRQTAIAVGEGLRVAMKIYTRKGAK